MNVPRLTHRFQSRRGALMAVALMLMVVGGLTLSAWVALMSTRAQQVSYLEDVGKRRLSLENSRVISRQLVLQNAYQRGDDQTPLMDYVLMDGSGESWGGTNTLAGWTALNAFASTEDASASSTVFPFNAGGLRPGDSFISMRRLTEASSMSAIVDPHDNYGFMKMACPPLRGDLFTVYAKPSNATDELDIHSNTNSHFGEWVVHGRMVIKDVDSLFAPTTPSPLQIRARCESLYLQQEPDNRLVAGTSLNGSRTPPSNLKSVPTTVGTRSGANPNLWSNQLDVIKNDANPENSIWHMMQREQDEGRGSYLTIDTVEWDYGAPNPPAWITKEGLSGTPTYPPPNWPSGYDPEWPVLFVDLDHPDLPHLRILGAVRQVVFLGQPPLSAEYDAAAIMGPLLVTIMPHPSLRAGVQDVRFVDANNRRWMLGLKGELPDRMEMYWEGASLQEPIPGRPGRFNNYNVWRGILVNEYRQVFANINAGQNVRWYGGVMTNWLFKRRKSAPGFPRNEAVTGLEFHLDASPQPVGAIGPTFSSLLPRDAWLETYFTPRQ